MTRNRERGERKRDREREILWVVFLGNKGEARRGEGRARSARRAVSRGLRTRNPRAMPIFAHATVTWCVHAYIRVMDPTHATATQTQLSDNTVHDDHGIRG